MTAQFLNQLPVTNGQPAEGAFRHAMHFHERVDVGEYRMMFHDARQSREPSRMSTNIAGKLPVLRGMTRNPISWAMENLPRLDVERLKASMIAFARKHSGRSLSMQATNGKNPDLYRDIIERGRDKNIAADAFLGIAQALGHSPTDYIIGGKPALSLSNVSALTSTFAILLDSVGIDPYEGERAQKLAAQFPNVLRSVQALGAGQGEVPGSIRKEDVLAPGEDPRAA